MRAVGIAAKERSHEADRYKVFGVYSGHTPWGLHCRDGCVQSQSAQQGQAIS
jgi:hypothetical protein